jgi:hypothetical protein
VTAPVRGWAVAAPDGELLLSSVRRTRWEVLLRYPDWVRLKLNGYRCIRVTITPEETK